MNPFDLPGPQFLVFFVVIFLMGVALTVYLRWYLRLPTPDPWAESPRFSPYEIAYLAGGEPIALQTAIAKMVHEGTLTHLPADHKLHPGKEPPGQSHDQLESIVYDVVKNETSNLGPAIDTATAPYFRTLKQRLVEKGLLLRSSIISAWVLIPLFVVSSIGVVKIGVGISRQRPVEILILLTIVSIVAMFLFFFVPARRSRRGDAVLMRMHAENAALQTQARQNASGLNGNDVALAVGLFGMAVLAGSTFGGLSFTLQRTFNRMPGGGDSFGSSSSCGGAGGCGGGGGGGCGGGGCGGCGGGGD